jgi:hypothetical protein
VPPRRVPVDPLAGPVAVTERAVIGDQLRRPAVWCEIRPCVARFDDPAALGEADVRARALAAGWRHDAIDRLVCPACQQRSPQVRARYLPAVRVPRGDHRAGPGHLQRGLLTAVRQVVTGWPGSHIRRLGAGTWWPGLLGTLAEGATAWNTRPWEPVTLPPSPVLTGDAVTGHRARHKAPGRGRLLPRPQPRTGGAGETRGHRDGGPLRPHRQ